MLEPSLEKPSLHVADDQSQGLAICGGGLLASSEAAQQIATGGGQPVITVENVADDQLIEEP